MRSLLCMFLFVSQALLIFGEPPVQLVCKASDAACLIAETRDMFTELVGGSSSLHTESLDPMFLDYIHVENEFKTDLRDCEVKGFKNAVIEDASIDMPTKTCYIRYITDLVLKSKYIADGKLFSTPIEGKGSFTLKYHNLRVEMKMPFDIIKDAFGDDIVILKSHTYTYDVRDNAEFFFDNLYYGKNNTASDAIHKSMHENWKALTLEFARYLLDPFNAKVFNSVLIFTRARPLKEYIEY